MVLRGGGEASTSSTDMGGYETENDGKSEGSRSRGDGIDDTNTQESSIYHLPYHGGKKTWESHNELVFLAGKEREKSSFELLNFSDQDVPNGPLTDIPGINKLRLWRVSFSLA
jgi:hypothetical protein